MLLNSNIIPPQLHFFFKINPLKLFIIPFLPEKDLCGNTIEYITFRVFSISNFKSMSKIILITGTSSGVGLHTAALLASKGNIVYATMRNLAKRNLLDQMTKFYSHNVRVHYLDVQKEDSVKECVDMILDNEQRIDVLINNAGAGFIRSLEQATMEEIQTVMNTNFYGPIRCIKAVLPAMREQSSGHIINISSVGGLVGQPLNEIYCAAKFALEGLTESIATYLTPYFGIKTSIIEPAGITTEFGNNIINYFNNTGGVREDAYMPLVNDYMAYRKTFTDELKAKIFQSPLQVALVIDKCISDPDPKLRYLTSAYAAEFTYLKSGLDPDGSQLQEAIRKRILNK
jgi:NAD(P)-dependent dehydrogenase (short-subunit alcohol dehydrogenase family)